MAAGKQTQAVMLATLLIIAASAAPAIQVLHAAEPNHTCELCQLGRVPVVEPECGPSIEAPSMLVERVECYPTSSGCATALSPCASRGPPV